MGLISGPASSVRSAQSAATSLRTRNGSFARPHRPVWQHGAPIWTHTTHFGELAVEQIDLLEDAGVDPSMIVVNHLGDREDTSGLLEIAKRGVYLSIDNIGYTGEGYPSDDVRVRSVMALAEAGYLDKTVLGTDIGTRAALRSYGGRGFAWLSRNSCPDACVRIQPKRNGWLRTHNVASPWPTDPCLSDLEAPVP